MKIFYFAWVRQKIGSAEETLSLPSAITNTGQLIDWLAMRGGGYKDALSNKNVIRIARNQEYCDWDEPLTDQDEVAIFPPVTGG